MIDNMPYSLGLVAPAVVIIFGDFLFLKVFISISIAVSPLCYPAQYSSGVIFECLSSD